MQAFEIKMEHLRAKHFVPFLLFLCLAKICTPTPTPSPPNPHNLSQNPAGTKKHFVLIHGAGHGAWCWYKVATQLTSIGHNATTLDMAASGINPKQVQQVKSFSDYVEPLVQFMQSLPPKERVILVGHSMGGAVVSIAMEKFPEKISAAVFVDAVMPGPTFSYLTIFDEISKSLDFMDSQVRYDDGPNNPPTSALWGPKLMSSVMYALSPKEDLTLGLSLVRFSPLLREEIKLTKEKYGSVGRVFIVCSNDQGVKEEWQRWMVKNNPPNEVKVINGSDHMVMFSKTTELVFNLQNIAEKYS